MSTLWTAQQREWLQAMGHQVWSLASMQAEEAPPAPAVDTGAAGARREADATRRDAAPRPPQQARTPPAGDRLLLAVLRAANRSAGDGHVEALLTDPSSLRGNAAAKRALWPKLRALRRRGGVA